MYLVPFQGSEDKITDKMDTELVATLGIVGLLYSIPTFVSFLFYKGQKRKLWIAMLGTAILPDQ